VSEDKCSVEQAIEIAETARGQYATARGESGAGFEGCVEEVDIHFARVALDWRLSTGHANQSPKTAAEPSPVAAWHERERAHEAGMHRRAQTSQMVQRRDFYAVEHDPRLIRRCAPHNQFPSRERGPSDAGHVFQCLARVALRAWSLAQFLGSQTCFAGFSLGGAITMVS
jgi:hypothetical protein